MKRRLIRLAVLMAGLASATAGAQEILAQWVESNPMSEADKLALGYPVPMPVDTPLPFDGFRTYMGLHTRHQDLAATTPWVHQEAVGQTHTGRTIYAYRLGDEDRTTPWGLPEPATLTNGGIHAREWQSPEVVTGILELMATQDSDRHFYDYLRDSVNMVVIPVMNIDGFLQTQRYPNLNYLGTDPGVPDTWPRDGRMRRKNMLGVDEDLFTVGDHLLGVDLNRNNAPYWNTNPQRSSDDNRSLVHHGAGPQSEPETQALDAAAALGPVDQLRLYTDVHSFSQVHFWVGTGNIRLSTQTQSVLGVFTNHHLVFPAGKFYFFADRFNVPILTGIGSTDEYFTSIYQVPSWTLEIEPSGGGHQGLPGSSADYGGTGVSHSGFILPESEIRRVREELAQSFASVYYRQAGPPSIQAMRLVDEATGAVVYEAEWDTVDDSSRTLFTNQLQPVGLGREYTFWLAFNKPMRWLDKGQVANFPGQPNSTQDLDADLLVGSDLVEATLLDLGWSLDGFGAPRGYLNYRTDALWVKFVLDGSENNLSLIDGETQTTLSIGTTDMTSMGLDADPSSVVSWSNGVWTGYNDNLNDNLDTGGRDLTLSFLVTDDDLDDPFIIEPGIAASWFDPDHDGEGFIIQILEDNRAVLFWFTYDGEGNQDWYISTGEVRGNRLLFPELLRVSGGVFGPSFDPDAVSSEVVGSAKFIWSGCDSGLMDWHIGNQRGRQELKRLSSIMGLDCGPPRAAPVREEALYSGAWFDPSHNGEGYVVEVLWDGRVIVYWFSFGPDGARRWFVGIGAIVNGKLVFDDMLTTRGGIFGDDFDPDLVERLPWGSLELDVTCEDGTATYDSTEEGFGSGVLNITKLTNLIGFTCDDS